MSKLTFSAVNRSYEKLDKTLPLNETTISHESRPGNINSHSNGDQSSIEFF